jgi:DNA-directed RNA polymerase I subunit RPA2
LRGLSSAALVAHNEEPEEFGGYFIINGNERLIRYLILPRRNHLIALVRPSFQNRGPTYTQFAVAIRCVRPDQTSVTNSLHYLSNGSAMLRFSWRKQEYTIPIMLLLKALVNAPDREIFEGIIMQDHENTFLTDRVELLLRSFKSYSLYTGEQCLAYLGDKFRVVLGMPEDWDNAYLGFWLVNKVILVHLESPREKFQLLMYEVSSVFRWYSPNLTCQLYASKAVLPRIVVLLCRQSRLSSAPGNSASRVAVRNDHQGKARRGTQPNSKPDCTRCPA